MKKMVGVIIYGMLMLNFIGYAEDVERIRKTDFAKKESLKILSILPNREQVPKFELFELNINLSATYDNPFDPDDVNLTAYFTSPGGKSLEIPSFFYQNYSRRILKEELRRKITQVKLMIEPWMWDEPEEVILCLDYLKLINSKTGETLLLSNGEEVSKWQGENGVIVNTADFEGNKVIKMTIPVADKRVQWEKLPGAFLSFKTMDWADYDKLEARVYFKVKGITKAVKGNLGMEFLDSTHGARIMNFYTITGDSPILRLNQWITFPWNFEEAAVQEILEKEGSPIWKVRFAPTEVGEYRYHVELKDRTGIVRSESSTFKVISSDRKGFIKVSKRNPRYFQFDNGETYFPIGQELQYYDAYRGSSGGTYYSERYLNKFSQNGINFIRCGSSPLHIERKLGEYDQKWCNRFDRILSYAERNNVYVMYVLGCSGDLDPSSWAHWNPYNIANGGVIDSPEKYLTDDKAKSYYKKRLRYIIARWGYHPGLFALEFWNELYAEDEFLFTSNAAVNWHKEMVNYLHQIDPYGHLTTCSFYPGDWDERGAKMWRVAGLDFVSPHTGGARSMSDSTSWIVKFMVNSYGKPFITGEINHDGCTDYDRIKDPGGIHIHNALWTHVMAGAGGAASYFNWIWTNTINCYYHFQAVAKFVEGEDFASSEFQPVELKADYIPGKEKDTVSDLEIYPLPRYKPCTWSVTINLNANKEIDKRILSGYLCGDRTITFKVNYPQDSEFGVYVAEVDPAGSNLKIYLDDELMLSKKFNDPFALSLRRYYDGLYSIKVPAGRHSIKAVCEKGAIYVGPYIFKNYKIGGSPDLRILGLQDEEKALLWLQNSHNTWLNYALGKKLSSIEDAKVDIVGLKDGQYLIEWWDTYKGKITEIIKGECKNGLLKILLPIIKTDVACKIKRGGS